VRVPNENAKADWVEEINKRLGLPSSTELPTELVESAIDDGVKLFNRWRPAYKYVVFDLVKGQSEYDVIDGVISVSEVYVAPTGTKVIEGSGYEYLDYIYQKQVRSISSVTNILNELERRELVSRLMYGWEYNPDEKKILIIPALQYSGKGVYKATMGRTLEEIPEKYEDGFKDLVVALTAELLMLRRGRFQSIPIGVGDMEFDIDVLKGLYDRKMKSAKQRLQESGTVITTG